MEVRLTACSRVDSYRLESNRYIQNERICVRNKIAKKKVGQRLKQRQE